MTINGKYMDNSQSLTLFLSHDRTEQLRGSDKDHTQDNLITDTPFTQTNKTYLLPNTPLIPCAVRTPYQRTMQVWDGELTGPNTHTFYNPPHRFATL